MAAVLVDSNVILDILTEDPEWMDWSAAALARSAEFSRLVINPIIYAEVSVGFAGIEELDEALPDAYFMREALPWPGAFLATQAFVRYREGGGPRLHPLPDFYIGAHAAVAGHTLLTRDARRYRTYFPRLKVIAP